MHVVVVPAGTDQTLTRATRRSVDRALPGVPCTAVDLADPSALATLAGVDLPAVHRAAIELPPDRLAHWVALRHVRALVASGESVLLARAGVEVLASAQQLEALPVEHGVCLFPRLSPPAAQQALLRRAAQDGAVAPELSCWAPGAGDALALAVRLTRDARTPGDVLGVVASVTGHGAAPAAALLSPWTLHESTRLVASPSLTADGVPVLAVDLSRFDHRRPWILAPDLPAGSDALLSRHPALADLCRRVAEERAADDRSDDPAADPWTTTAAGWPVHEQLRQMYRSGHPAADDRTAPDPFDPAAAQLLRDWLLEPLPAGHPAPVARYLADVYAGRPDLREAFPLVPGQDTGALLNWAGQHGAREDRYDAGLLRAAVESSRGAARPVPAPVGPPRPGVTVVGYLAGELGVGESARLMLSALAAGGVPHGTVPVAHQLQSRQRAHYPAVDGAGPFTTTLLCVNADQTPGLARALAGRFDASHRIGMWYWEVEDFPAAQRGGFDHVDEVWVATEFIRDAIAPHAPVPVLTVPPPLPQRPERAPAVDPLPGVPADRPVLLFSFDFLSSAERKNPWGVVEAFRRAFRPGEGPLLVVKSINGDRDVPAAERLRLLVADRPDVLLVERYLDAEERDALVARCTAYVSLHRSEGLGLTMAEAMAWGRPVIATAYSGNLDFMTEDNSLLVPWTPTAVPADCPPYPAGSRWADPDLDAAAAAMRRVVQDPEWAERLGRRAAADIRDRHSPAAAAVRVRARLDEIERLRADAVPGLATRAARRATRVLRRG